MKYTDADRLRAEIIRLREDKPFHDDSSFLAYLHGLSRIEDFIDSLQPERTEDIVVIAKIFLDALSKTPYNNKPITDAQIIVRQLLLFFENPKEYNPDAIWEQPEEEMSDKTLDEAAEEYLYGDPEFFELLRDAFKAGAKWMAGQGVTKEAVIGMATKDIEINVSQRVLDALELGPGDKVIVQIRRR